MIVSSVHAFMFKPNNFHFFEFHLVILTHFPPAFKNDEQTFDNRLILICYMKEKKDDQEVSTLRLDCVAKMTPGDFSL